MSAWGPLASAQSLDAAEPDALINLLRQTRAVNIESVVDAQFEHAEAADGFQTVDPYGPQASETVRTWYDQTGRDEAICAVRFNDASRAEYELRDFDSSTAAARAGFIITHAGRCGTCSTLRDLAAYLATPDLTTPARRCARRSGLERKKQCFVETIGFTPLCAESWAYNAANTRQECLGTCISDYGLLNLAFGRYPGDNVDESGQLRPCLQCDEDRSGPGFKYSAGRTRRNSGIESAIERPASDLFHVDHSTYFLPKQ